MLLLLVCSVAHGKQWSLGQETQELDLSCVSLAVSLPLLGPQFLHLTNSKSIYPRQSGSRSELIDGAPSTILNAAATIQSNANYITISLFPSQAPQILPKETASSSC